MTKRHLYHAAGFAGALGISILLWMVIMKAFAYGITLVVLRAVFE